MKLRLIIRSRHYERQAHTISHAGPALSEIIGDATVICFGSIYSLPLDCRSSTYEAKLRPRVSGFVSEVDHNFKSSLAESQCKLKKISVSFQFS